MYSIIQKKGNDIFICLNHLIVFSLHASLSPATPYSTLPFTQTTPFIYILITFPIPLICHRLPVSYHVSMKCVYANILPFLSSHMALVSTNAYEHHYTHYRIQVQVQLYIPNPQSVIYSYSIYKCAYDPERN